MPDAVASIAPSDNAEPDASSATLPKVAVQRTEFGVDVGGANSVAGLRALWRGLLKSKSNAALTTLRPIIVVKEGNNGLGMQLRLVAGPLDDAAAAAKICAGLIESKRTCETTVFDGQRLAIKARGTARRRQAGTAPPRSRPSGQRPKSRPRNPSRQCCRRYSVTAREIPRYFAWGCFRDFEFSPLRCICLGRCLGSARLVVACRIPDHIRPISGRRILLRLIGFHLAGKSLQ